MAKATNASNPRRRGVQSAKPLDAPRRQKTGPPVFSSRAPHKQADAFSAVVAISGMAQIVANFDRLYIKMDTGCTRAKWKLEEQGLNGHEYSRVLSMQELFKALQTECNDTAEAMKQIILRIDPRNADEALTLLILASGEFDYFAADHPDHDNPAIEQRAQKIERALHAVCRGLLRAGAKSPLVEDYLSKTGRLSSCEQINQALAFLPELEGVVAPSSPAPAKETAV